MVQFVSVCTSVVRVYLCGYVCLSRHSCGVHTRIKVHMVHFVSVCTSVVRAYLWVYVCLLSVIVICIFMRVCVTRME